MARTRTVQVELPVQCSVCGGQHLLHGTAELIRQAIVFGGGGEQQDGPQTVAGWKVTSVCPRQGKPFEGSVLVPARYDESVRRIEVDAVTDAPAGSSAAPATGVLAPSTSDWVDEELKEWRKNTVATQRAFSTSMLTASSAGVAIYFAVLKYLGWEHADFSAPLVVLTVLPPALLLLAACAFALALRPSLSYVDREKYAEFRAHRVGEIHRRLTIGTLLYISALVVAVAVFLAILEAAS